MLAAAGALAWGLSQVATGLVAAGEHGHEHAVVGSSEGETGSEHVEPVVVQRTDIEHSNPVLRSPATTAQTHDDAHGEGHDDETHDDDAHGDAHRQ